MLKQIIILSIIYGISIFYNSFIQPEILNYIKIEYYNNIVISLLILIQIDNFILFYDLSKKVDLETSHTKIEDKYLKIILNQIAYINKKENDYNKKVIKMKENHKKYKSYNDISELY